MLEVHCANNVKTLNEQGYNKSQIARMFGIDGKLRSYLRKWTTSFHCVLCIENRVTANGPHWFKPPAW